MDRDAILFIFTGASNDERYFIAERNLTDTIHVWVVTGNEGDVCTEADRRKRRTFCNRVEDEREIPERDLEALTAMMSNYHCFHYTIIRNSCLSEADFAGEKVIHP